MTDRVARYMGGGVVQIVPEPVEELPAGGLVVRAEACGLCSGELMAWYMDKKIPHVLGHEVAGVVEQSDDERFPVGCRVFPHHHAPCLHCEECARGAYVHCPQWRTTKLLSGGMADRFAVPAENLNDTIRVDDLRPIDAALIEPLACVVKAFRQGGIGFQPMGRTGILPVPPDRLTKRAGAYLPHWRERGGIYAVTFRLSDSLPKEFLERMREQKLEAERMVRSGSNVSDAKALSELSLQRVAATQSELDKGYGACVLKDGECARTVEDALRHFDGDRYKLHAYAVMPNHVHVVVEPLGEYRLEDVTHSWKSYTANQINRHRGQTGDLWQSESYDRLIRDETEYANQVDYVLDNPVKAGIANWPFVGRGTGERWRVVRDAGAEQGLEAPETHRLEADATSVAVIGLGFMGLLHMFLAPGAKGYDLNPLRRQWASDQGLSVAHPDDATPAETVFVCPGSQAAFDLAMRIVKPQGTVVMFAPLPPGEDLKVPQEAYFRDVTIAHAYSCGPDDTAAATELLRAGVVRAERVVERFIPLDGLPEAYVDMRDGRILKAMVVWPEA